MAPPTNLGAVSLAIKAALLFLIVISISIASYGIFGSDSYKEMSNLPEGSTRLSTEKGSFVQGIIFIVFAVFSFLTLAASLLTHCVGPKGSRVVIIGDIALCAVSATLLLIGGGLLAIYASGEFDKNHRYYGDDYKTICKKMNLSIVKIASGAFAVLVALFGFCAPCGLAVKVHKKEPQNAETAVGGNVEQPGGGATGAPQYQMYVAAPPEYQAQYGGGYVYETQQPQMVPSQNHAGAYPPPQGGVPQYVPTQGGQQQY